MHIKKNKSTYRFAALMVSISVLVIFLSFAVITLPSGEKYLGAVNVFDNRGEPAIVYAVNYPTAQNKSVLTLINPFGTDYSGFPKSFDHKINISTASGDYYGMKIICAILELGGNKFSVYLYDEYGGLFTDNWPVVIESSSCSSPVIYNIGNDPVIFLHTENKLYALNSAGDNLPGFPLTIPLGDNEFLNSGIAFMNNKIIAASNTGNYYIKDLSGRFSNVSTGQPSEHKLIVKNNMIIRAYPNGYQTISSDGTYSNFNIAPERVSNIGQPITAIDDNNLSIINSDKELSVYNINGNKNRGFMPLSRYSDISAPPLFDNIDTDAKKEILVGGSTGIVYDISGYKLPRGNYAPGFPTQPLPDAPCSPLQIADINSDGRMDILAPCADGNIYYLPTYQGEGPWIMPESLENYLFYQPPSPAEIIPAPRDRDTLPPFSGMRSENYRVICDAATGVRGWEIYDNPPPPGSISRDGVENAVRLQGNRQSTGYRLRNQTEAGIFTDLNDTRTGIGFSLKYNEPFTVYVSVDTIKGHRYLYYTPSETDYGCMSTTDEYIHFGLGARSYGGGWRRFYRHLREDLQKFQPDNDIIDVNAFLIRGSGLARNVFIFNPVETAYESVLNVCENRYEINVRHDENGRVTRKEIIFTDEQGNMAKKELQQFEWDTAGNLIKSTTTYYYMDTPVTQYTYYYDKGVYKGYQYNLLGLGGSAVYTYRYIYEPETTNPNGNKVKNLTYKYFYNSADGAVDYYQEKSVYNADNKLLSAEKRYFECFTALNGGEWDANPGALLYSLSTEYLYEDTQNNLRCTQEITTKSDPQGNVFEKNKYIDRRFDRSGRLIFQKQITQRGGAATAINEFSYIYGDGAIKYIYVYKDGQGNLKGRYTYIYENGTGRARQFKYEYPAYSCTYKNYIYDRYNKIKQYDEEFERPGLGKISSRNIYFYNRLGDTYYTIRKSETNTTVLKYIYDNYRRYIGYKYILMTPNEGEACLANLNGGNEPDFDTMPGVTRVIYNVLARDKGKEAKTEYRYYYYRDNAWALNYYFEIDYIYDALRELNSVFYRYYNKVDKKTSEYEYNYTGGLTTRARYRYFNSAGFAYRAYEYNYSYISGSSRIDSIIFATYQGGQKTGESITKYIAYDNRNNAVQTIQYNVALPADLINSVYDTHYFYNGSMLKRYVQTQHRVINSFPKENIQAAEPELELIDIFELRNVDIDNSGRLRLWKYLYWDASYLDRVLSEELNYRLARVWTDITDNYDGMGRRSSLYYDYYMKNSNIFTRYAPGYDLDTAVMNQYKIQSILKGSRSDDIFYELTFSYKYNDFNEPVEYNSVYSQIDGIKYYLDILYSYDPITGFLNRANFIYYTDFNGEKTPTTKREDLYSYDPKTGYAAENVYKYYSAKENEWIYTGKDIYKNFEYTGGRAAKYNVEGFNYDDRRQYIVTFETQIDEIGRVIKYLYRYDYPNDPNRRYIYKYELLLDPNNYSRAARANAIYCRADTEEELYRWIYDYIYDETGALIEYKSAYAYPDGSILYEYLYTYNYDRFRRRNRLAGRYLMDGEEYADYNAISDPSTGRYINDFYRYKNVNKIFKYYDYKYNKFDNSISYKTDFYKDNIAPDKLIGRGLYVANLNDRQQITSTESNTYSSAGRLESAYRWRYSDDGLPLEYNAVNYLTGGSLSINIKERQWGSIKKVEKIVRNSPPITYTLNYILDQFGRKIGMRNEVRDETDRLIRIEEENYDPLNFQLISWNKKYMADDGITVKEERSCSNVIYLSEFFIGAETVNVTPGNYTMTVEHVYDDQLRYVANNVITTDGRDWTEHLDYVTGNILYIINNDSGERYEDSSAPSSGSSSDDPGSGPGSGASRHPSAPSGNMDNPAPAAPGTSPNPVNNLTGNTPIEYPQQINNSQIQNQQSIEQGIARNNGYLTGSIVIPGQSEPMGREETGPNGETLSNSAINSIGSRTQAPSPPASSVPSGHDVKDMDNAKERSEEFYNETQLKEQFAREEPINYNGVQLQQRFDGRRTGKIYKKLNAENKDKQKNLLNELIKRVIEKIILWGKKVIPDIAKTLNGFERLLKKNLTPHPSLSS